MGRIIILHDASLPSLPEEHEFEGRYIDFLENRFPDGFKTECNATFVNASSNPVPTEDFEFEINQDDLVVLTFMPAGLTPIEWVYLIISIVSIAAAVLYKPSLPNSVQTSQDAAKSLYSVGVKANEPALGGTISVGYGNVVSTPNYAAQSYRVFDAQDNEIRYFQLVVGLGDYDVERIIIGNTPEEDLPDNLIEWQAFKPSEHNKQLGVIESAFGIHENVYTSGEVSNQELESDFSSRFDNTISIQSISETSFEAVPNYATSSSYNEYPDDDEWSPLPSGFGDGDVLIVEDGPNQGTYELLDIDEYTLTIKNGSFPDLTVTSMPIRLTRDSVKTPGPFVVCPSGKTTELIQVDLEYPAGLFKTNTEGSFSSNSSTVEFTIQQIDDAGADIGDPFFKKFVTTGSNNDPKRRTYSIPVEKGRYKVKAQLVSVGSNKQTDGARTIWTGLRSFLDYGTEEAYGETTIVAIKVTGSQAISASSQQQIKVQSQRLLKGVPTNNPADIIEDIYTNPHYGAGRPSSELDAAALADFYTKCANRPFHGVFDSKISIWNALKTVALIGYAEPEPLNAGLSVSIDEEKPVRASIISPANILKGSYKAAYSWLRDGDNDGFEVEYKNANSFISEYVTYPETSLNPQKTLVVGITFPDQALKMAKYLWRQKILRNMAFECRMELDPLNFKRKDRVGVPLPILNWGDSAVVKHRDGRKLTLSANVAAGEIYMQFRTLEGECSSIVTAQADGSKVIQLNEDPPCEISYAGDAEPTICATGNTQDLMTDIIIESVEPNGDRVRVRGVNYIDTITADL